MVLITLICGQIATQTRLIARTNLTNQELKYQQQFFFGYLDWGST